MNWVPQTIERIMTASDKMATIEVRTSHLGFSFLQALCRPVIEIDGKPHPAGWGSHSFSVTPGQHNIKAYHRWMLIREAYASSISVTAAEGQILKLHWHTGWISLCPGQWSES